MGLPGTLLQALAVYLAGKHDNEQSNLTSVRHTCNGSKNQIPTVLLRVAMELISDYLKCHRPPFSLKKYSYHRTLNYLLKPSNIKSSYSSTNQSAAKKLSRIPQLP